MSVKSDIKANMRDIILLKNGFFAGKRFMVESRRDNCVIINVNRKNCIIKDSDYTVERKYS